MLFRSTAAKSLSGVELVAHKWGKREPNICNVTVIPGNLLQWFRAVVCAVTYFSDFLPMRLLRGLNTFGRRGFGFGYLACHVSGDERGHSKHDTIVHTSARCLLLGGTLWCPSEFMIR